MNLDKDTIIEKAQQAARKAVDVVNPVPKEVTNVMNEVRDSAMSAINDRVDEVAAAERPEVGSVEVKQGEGVEEVVKGGIQAALGGVKVFAEAAAKGIKSDKKLAEAAKSLVKGDTEGAKAKLKESKDALVDAAKHATLGQAENQAQAAERIFKGAKQLGKDILGLEQVQTDWQYESPANNNGWFMSDLA